MKRIIKVLNGILNICNYSAGILIIIVFFIMIAQVFTRYLFNYSFTWSEELACYLTIYAMTLASVTLYRKGTHPRVEIVYDALPKKARYYLNYVFYIIIGAFLVLLVLYGSKLVISSIKVLTPAARISKAIPVSAVAVSSLLMLLQSFGLFYDNYMSYRKTIAAEKGGK